VLFPGLRLGYCVVPESELARVSAACHLLYRDLSLVPQKIVADFMTRGHFARHVKRMRALYAERREALADALAQVFQDGLQLQASTGGMHLTMNLEAGAPDIALVTRAKVFGVRPGALSTWYIDKRSAARGLLLSFTNVPCERSIEVVERLKQAIDR